MQDFEEEEKKQTDNVDASIPPSANKFNKIVNEH